MTLGTITSTLSSQLSLKNGASSAQATIAEPVIRSPSTSPVRPAVNEGEATSNVHGVAVAVRRHSNF